MSNKEIKKYLKNGHRITIIYDATASTGDVATTICTFKSYKRVIKQLEREGIAYNIQIMDDKWTILRQISDIIYYMEENIQPKVSKRRWQNCTENLKDLILNKLTNYLEWRP